MNVKEAEELLKKLCVALEAESAAIDSGDIELLEKQSPNIENLFEKLEKVPDSLSGEDLNSLTAKAIELRKENIEKLKRFIKKSEKEMRGVKRGREVCRAYGTGKKEQEIFVKKDC